MPEQIVTVGTFNLNNLFSRFSFKGDYEVAKVKSEEKVVEFEDGTYVLRKYKGTLIKQKPAADRKLVADRIKAMDVDVLGVQEVEDIDTLKYFARDDLDGLYRYAVLVEGNDDRLIDVGVLSKKPIGAVRSWRFAVHKDDPGEPVFGRDLLEVEILADDRSRVLFTLFNTHLKSQLVDWKAEDEAAEKAKNDLRRTRQAEVIAKTLAERHGAGGRYVLVGDMNDVPDSTCLVPFAALGAVTLTNALANATESAAINDPNSQPATPVWTHRFKASGQPARYELYDQIWLSTALKDNLDGARILRRKKLTGDGSDHDPAWVTLKL